MRKRSYGMNDHGNRNNNGGRRQHYRNNNNNQNFNPASGVSQEDAMLARQRRNAAPNYQKYMNMAREALGSGDRVQAEYYLQHAEHYFRVMADDPAQQQRRERQQRHQQQGQHQGQSHHYAQDGQENAASMPQEDGAAAAAAEGPPSMGPVPPYEDSEMPIGSSLGSVNPMPAERYRRRSNYSPRQPQQDDLPHSPASPDERD